MCEVSRFLLWKIRHSLTEQLVLMWVIINKIYFLTIWTSPDSWTTQMDSKDPVLEICTHRLVRVQWLKRVFFSSEEWISQFHYYHWWEFYFLRFVCSMVEKSTSYAFCLLLLWKAWTWCGFFYLAKLWLCRASKWHPIKGRLL